MIAGVADTHTALWHLFGDAKLSRTAANFIQEPVAKRRKIALFAISMPNSFTGSRKTACLYVAAQNAATGDGRL